MISLLDRLVKNRFFIGFFLIEVGILIIHGLWLAFVGGCFLGLLAGLYAAMEQLNNTNKGLMWGLFLSGFLAVAFAVHGWYLCVVSLLLLIGLYLLYSSLKILIDDHFTALLLFLAIVLGCSFIPEQYQAYAVVIGLIGAVGILLTNRLSFQKQILHDWSVIKSLETYDLVCWELIALSINAIGFFCRNNFYCLDKFHPLYELSIGHSFKHGFLNVPDLSYAGKLMKFHFLSTRLPILFSNIFSISLLDAVYFITPLFFTIIVFVLINYFFIKYKQIAVPVFTLFFLPLLGLPGFFECLFNRFLGPASYFLGLILMILGSVFLIQRQRVPLMLCASMLLVTKASFFLTFAGGIVLYFLRQKDFKALLTTMLPLGAIFLWAYPRFLSGAHTHNLWILVPSPLYSAFLWGNENCIELIPFLVTLACLLYVLYKYPDHKELCGLASISLSGAIGFCLLTEVSELNSYQFAIAAFFSTSVLLWYVLKKVLTESAFFNRCFALIEGPASSLEARNGQIRACQFLGKGIVFFLIVQRIIFCCYPFLPMVRAAVALPEKEIFIGQDYINAYGWLAKNVSDSATVLFGKHYEMQSKNFWPSTGFMRSALSGKQMLSENFRFKGIIMEPDFVERCVLTIMFYKNFVISSEKSAMNLSLFFDQDFGKNPGIPLSQSPNKRMRLLHHLSLGKEWYVSNRQGQVEYEIAQALKEGVFENDDAIKFLRDFAITHIALENGDQPTSFLTAVARKIYSNKTISFWEITLG